MKRLIEINCSFCQKPFLKEKAEIKRQNKNGKKDFYCSSECCGAGVSKKTKVYKSIERSCLFCGNIFLSSDDPQARKCCSKKCASLRSYSFQTAKSNLSRSEKTKKSWENGKYKNKKRVLTEKLCLNCGGKFQTKRDPHSFCSTSCARRYKKSEGLTAYRIDSKFLFNLKDYPEEFDFSLIEERGWYSASNRGNNLQGISRDHMFSVKDGYILNVDPKIVSHPANCCLMPHFQNISKNYRSSISLDELMARIETWDTKYS